MWTLITATPVHTAAMASRRQWTVALLVDGLSLLTLRIPSFKANSRFTGKAIRPIREQHSSAAEQLLSSLLLRNQLCTTSDSLCDYWLLVGSEGQGLITSRWPQPTSPLTSLLPNVCRVLGMHGHRFY